jgi:tRNA-dihydrouridine synthase B
LKIGNVEIKGYTVLAPMAGVADTAFRTICKSFGTAYVVGEMASAKGLCMSGEKSRELLEVTPEERPMAVQLFGSDPGVMEQAARLAMDFRPDIIDINMGCPTPKITSNGSGSALMREPALAGRIIERVAAAVDVPVTVKLRKGWDGDSVNAVELAKIAQGSGAAAITLHGRTREQQYAPPADLEIIARVKSAVSIPVIGNGDVTSPQEAKRMLDFTGCDLVMIGRGALGNPWIFKQTEAYLRDGRLIPPPAIGERMDVMLRHIRLLCDIKGEYAGMREARRHAAWYMRGLSGAAALRNEACALERFEDIERLAEKVLRSNQGSEF